MNFYSSWNRHKKVSFQTISGGIEKLIIVPKFSQYQKQHFAMISKQVLVLGSKFCFWNYVYYLSSYITSTHFQHTLLLAIFRNLVNVRQILKIKHSQSVSIWLLAKISTRKYFCEKERIFTIFFLIFDVEMHGNNEIYTFSFSFLCFCFHLEWFDQNHVLRNTKINTHIFFQNIDFVEISNRKNLHQ